MYLYSKLFAKSLFGEEVGNNRHKINTKGHTHTHTHAHAHTPIERERDVSPPELIFSMVSYT